MFDFEAWILIPLFALSIPIIAIVGGLVTASMKGRRDVAERAEARKLYERLAMEKLDIVKTAIGMGYKSDDLADLDERLERLLGEDKMRELIDTPGKSSKKDKNKSAAIVQVKVQTSGLDSPAKPPKPTRIPSPAVDTFDESLLSDELDDSGLMDRATLEALSAELERRKQGTQPPARG